jgi:hypothetical protein
MTEDLSTHIARVAIDLAEAVFDGEVVRPGVTPAVVPQNVVAREM